MLNTLQWQAIGEYKMKTKPLIDKHRGHPKEVIPRLRNSNTAGQHYGEVRCRLCNEFVRWASKREVLQNETA